jgi:hypothetical protein
MLTAPPEEGSFLAFSDLLTGYRLSSALLLAHEAGVFETIGREGREGGEVPELCAGLGWEPVCGERFLACLGSLGLLRQEGGRYRLSPFAQQYLWSGSPHYQGRTLVFERQLRQSWDQLGATLQTGRRTFATGDKSPEELRQALETYLGAMDEAAGIRAGELWETVPISTARGTLLDIGAGSGAFLAEFLERHPGWRAIFCDLPEVVANQALHRRLTTPADRIQRCGCNLLADGPSDFDTIPDKSCHLVLLSNLIHCQGEVETDRLVRKAAAKTTECGLLVIHDFFSDTGWRGALYDIHMMLNTYNGKTYPQQEILAMAATRGFYYSRTRQLRSGSTALVLARHPEVLAL